MAIRIITDSTSDITKEQAKELGINVVPLKVRIDNQEYLDGETITHSEFYEKLKKAKEFPTTSQPTPEQFLKCFEEAKQNQETVIAILISGKLSGTVQSAKIAKELGGRALPLKVSGPFHCSMYKDASYKFYEEVKKAEINDFKKVVYSNVKGAPYKKDDDIKELLRQQIMSPVLFEKSIRDLINKGVDTFIEVGPGKALSGFVKKIDKSVKIYNVCDIDSLESTISSLEL